MITISFVVLSYNRPVETIEVIDNIVHDLDDAQGLSKEIVVVNNGSTVSYSDVDTHIQSLPQANIKYIDHHTNLGVSGGRNLGIKNASGRYIVFIDDDAVFKETDIMEKIHQKFTNDPSLGIIGFAVYNFFTSESDHPVKDQRKLAEHEFYNNIFWGCGFVVLDEVFNKLGPFDDYFFYGMEEYDLAYRTINDGYKILFTKDISVLHKVSLAGREKNYVKYSRMFINKSLIAYRYLPWKYVMSHIFMWSGFFLVKSGGKIGLYVKSLRTLLEKIRQNKRQPISQEAIAYVQSVSGRLSY